MAESTTHEYSSNGICTKCGSSREAIERFGWECGGNGGRGRDSGARSRVTYDVGAADRVTAPHGFETENVFYRGRFAGHLPSVESESKRTTGSDDDLSSEGEQLEIGDYGPLLELATPDVYRRNGFRILGLSTDASTQAIPRRFEKVQMAAEFGGDFPGGSGPLPLDPPPAAELLREASQQLRDTEKRFLQQIFWFAPVHENAGDDDPGLEVLAEGDAVGASEAWRAKLEGSSSVDALHNLAVLNHVLATDVELSTSKNGLSREDRAKCESHWNDAFRYWKLLLKKDDYWKKLSTVVEDLDDPRLTLDVVDKVRKTLPIALLVVSGRLAVAAADRGDFEAASRRISHVVASGFGKRHISAALRIALTPVQTRLSSLIEQRRSEANDTPSEGAAIGFRLIEEAGPMLGMIDIAFGAGDATRDAVFDEFVNRAMDCHIAYGNETGDWTTEHEFFDKLDPYLASETVRSRLDKERGQTAQLMVGASCWFCGQHLGLKQDSEHSIEIAMYGDVVETSYNIQWRHGKINVPRCEGCKEIHARHSWTLGVTIAWSVGIAILGIVFANSADSFGVFLLIAAIAVGVGVAKGWNDQKEFSGKGIKPESDKVEYPEIKKLRRQGWEFGEQPAIPQQ